MTEKDCDEIDIPALTPSTGTSSSYPAWHNAVAGGAAGAGARMVTAPLDLIRIRRQLAPRTTYPSESMFMSWRSIVQNEGGVGALFRGNTPAIFLWVGYSAIQFSLYNRTKEAVTASYDPKGHYPTTTAFVAGATAGLFATIATYPFDVCRTIFAAQGIVEQKQAVHVAPFSSLVEPHYNDRTANAPRLSPASSSSASLTKNSPPKTIIEFAGQLHRQKGIMGFYAGSTPAVIQIIPYMGLNFAIYDSLTRGDRRVGLSAYAGAISGAISKIVIYPVDTVKRRLQAQAFFHGQHFYAGMWDCLKTIARKEGIASFYRGVVPSVMKTTISTGLSFSFFRFGKNTLERIHYGGR
jgi:solute carrier family 25 thiamine pyrophosphate transporter 19